jgi:hypothetical protein
VEALIAQAKKKDPIGERERDVEGGGRGGAPVTYTPSSTSSKTQRPMSAARIRPNSASARPPPPSHDDDDEEEIPDDDS